MKRPFISYYIPSLGEVKHSFEQKGLEVEQIAPSLKCSPNSSETLAVPIFFFLEGFALLNHCFSSVFRIYHIQNSSTEDFREICVSMLCH